MGTAAGRLRIDALDLTDEYFETGDPETMRRAVELFVAAVRLMGDQDPLKVRTCRDLCVAGRLRYDDTGDLAALREAVTAGRWAHARTPVTQCEAGDVANFSLAVRLLGEHLSDAGLLHEAVELGRLAVTIPPPDFDGHLAARGQFGEALEALHRRTDNPASLDELVTLAQASVALLPPRDERRLHWLHIAGKQALALYKRTRDPARIATAMDAARTAIAESAATDPRRADHLWLMGDVLIASYEAGGGLPVLREAVTALRASVRTGSGDRAVRVIRTETFGRAMLMLFFVTKDPAVLREAAARHRESLALLNGSPSVAWQLQLCLQALAAVTDDLAAWREVVTVGRAAARSPVGTPKRVDCLLRLADAARRVYIAAGDTAMLEESVTAGRAVVREPSASPAQYLEGVSELHRSLRTRFDDTHDPEPLREAIAAQRSVLASTVYRGWDLSTTRLELGANLAAAADSGP